MNKRTKKTLSIDGALLRLRKYCAFTERSKEEVKRKLQNYNLAPGEPEIIMDKLVKEGFINELRFAKAFAGGKFRMKKWGKRKIEVEMKKKGLSEELIEKGLEELPAENYAEALDELLQKKWKQVMRSTKDNESYEGKQANQQKLIRYALQKGYEMDIIVERLRKMNVDK